MRIFLALLGCVTTVAAFNPVPSADWGWPGGAEYSAGAEAIYWKPCVSPFRFGNRTNGSVVEQLDLEADATGGFRIFGAIVGGRQCTLLSADWTFLNATGNQTVSGDDLRVYRINDGFDIAREIRADYAYRFQRVTGRVGYFFCRSNCASLYGYIGFHWTRICGRQNLSSKGTGAPDSRDVVARQKFESTGTGPEVGFGGEFGRWCGFGLNGRIGLAMLIGKRHNSASKDLSGQQGATAGFIDIPARNGCIPALNMRGGLFWTKTFPCIGIRWELGYEIEYYRDFLFQFRYPTTNNNTFTTDIGFAGPYCSLELLF